MTHWQYVHEYIDTSKLWKKVELGGTEEDVFDESPDYSQTSIQNYLNKMGADGWELIMMEPRWIWTQRSDFGLFAHPEIIAGYWCTFKRAEL